MYKNAAPDIDPKTQERTISLDGTAGKIPLFCVEPENTKILPGLILTHEIFGVNEHIKDLARRFAKHSLRVFAPDLFAGSSEYPIDRQNRDSIDCMRQIWSNIPDQQLISDLNSVFLYAQKHPNILPSEIGAIGYCMGGAIALMFACECPELAWVVDYYGRIKYTSTSNTKPRHPLDYVATLKCPLLGLFAGIDDLIPQEHIELLSRKLEEYKKTSTIKVYPNAKHAFFNDRRENYHPEAAQDAWQLTLAFINKYSKSAKLT